MMITEKAGIDLSRNGKCGNPYARKHDMRTAKEMFVRDFWQDPDMRKRAERKFTGKEVSCCGDYHCFLHGIAAYIYERQDFEADIAKHEQYSSNF